MSGGGGGGGKENPKCVTCDKHHNGVSNKLKTDPFSGRLNKTGEVVHQSNDNRKGK